MVKHACADDLVEARLQFARPLKGKLAHLKIAQLVFSFELFGMAPARFAEIDTGDSRRRPAHRVLGGLRRPAARDQDRMIFAI